MNKSKKAISGYIITLLGTSFALTLLFLMIFNIIYQKENPACSDINFDIENLCVDNKALKFKVANRAESSLEFLLNGADHQELVQGEAKTFIINTNDIKTVKITPMVTIREDIFFCKSKNKDINILEVTRKC